MIIVQAPLVIAHAPPQIPNTMYPHQPPAAAAQYGGAQHGGAQHGGAQDGGAMHAQYPQFPPAEAAPPIPVAVAAEIYGPPPPPSPPPPPAFSPQYQPDDYPRK